MWFERRKLTWPDNNQPSFFSQIWKLLLAMICGVLIVVWWYKLYFVAWDWIKTIPSKILVAKENNKTPNKNLPSVNALLVWVGGEGHRWSYNADTIIFASYNPNIKTLSMLSIPRDLYVNITWNMSQRINYTMEYYMWKWETLAYGADKLREKVSSIVWQRIDYYAVIDFNTFEKFIDDLGWVEVDVPERLVDTSFPVDDYNYGTLIIEDGLQTMDGETALNYARSRHSTSDFDRSKRQQIIIKAVMSKLLSFSSISKIDDIYSNISNLITTNAGLWDIIKYFPYARQLDNMSSWVLQSDCPANLNQMLPWCLLYSPSRDLFGGAAVIIPYGATPSKLSYYTNIQKFAKIILGDNSWLYTDKTINIYNSIDRNLSKRSVASELWVELIRYGYDVNFVGNNSQVLDHTYILDNSWSNSAFLKQLNNFMSFQFISKDDIWTGIVEQVIEDSNDSPVWVMWDEDNLTWIIDADVSYSGEYFIGQNIEKSDISILIWNDFIIKTWVNYNTIDSFLEK